MSDPREKMDPVWRASNDLAKMVKKEEPVHPTVIVLAGADDWKIEAVARLIPEIGMRGLNVFSDYANLPAKLDRAGREKPVLITEFGPPVRWLAPRIPSGAVVQPPIPVKARKHAELFYSGLLADMRVQGSFAFIGGTKRKPSSPSSAPTSPPANQRPR